MLRQACELRVGSGTREDLGIFFSSDAAALPFESARNHGRPAAGVPRSNSPVDKFNEILW
jgi:hypothetical protein